MLILGVNINQIMKRESPIFTGSTEDQRGAMAHLVGNLYLGVTNTKIGLRNISNANADVDSTAN